MDVCAHHVHTRPEPPSLYTEVPPEFEAILLRCLAKSPGDRFSSARALNDALAALELASPWSNMDIETWWREAGKSGRDAAPATRSTADPLSPTMAVDLRMRADWSDIDSLVE